MSNLYFGDLEEHRAEIDRHRENSARLAMAFGKFEFTGQGTYEYEDRIDFGVTFVEEPYVSYGSRIDMDDLRDLLELDNSDTPPIPLMTGTVTEWDQDERDFYVGAWVAVTVYFAPAAAVPVDVMPISEHYFTFAAIAIKDVPVDDD